jgi:hypothetical protein
MIGAGTVRAELNIEVGENVLLANKAGQEITLHVSGDQMVTGFNLRAQIGDGLGPGAEPIFEDVNFAGGIWDAFPYTVLGGPVAGAEQFAQGSVVFNEAGQSVIGDGILLILIIDTTGIFDGTYDLKLTSTDIGADSAFVASGGAEMPTNISNGTIVVPSPPLVSLVMQQPKVDPNEVFTRAGGLDSVRFLWSEPIVFSAADLTITNETEGSVPFIVDGNTTQFMDITFDTPLLYDRYVITIHDSVTSAATGAAIDGDNDGFAGGHAVIVMEHRQRHDSDNDNNVDFLDFRDLAHKWLWHK